MKPSCSGQRSKAAAIRAFSTVYDERLSCSHSELSGYAGLSANASTRVGLVSCRVPIDEIRAARQPNLLRRLQELRRSLGRPTPRHPHARRFDAYGRPRKPCDQLDVVLHALLGPSNPLPRCLPCLDPLGTAKDRAKTIGFRCVMHVPLASEGNARAAHASYGPSDR